MTTTRSRCGAPVIPRPVPPLLDAGAYVIYEAGKNSFRANGAIRTLKAWATSDISADPFTAPYLAAFGNDTTFLNTWMVAINTSAPFTTDAARAAAELATVHSSIQTLYMMHEIDTAWVKTQAGSINVTTGAPHNVDEAWGIWAGDAQGACSLDGLVKEGAAAAGTVAGDFLPTYLTIYDAAKTGDSAAYAVQRSILINRGIVLPGLQLTLSFAKKVDQDPFSASGPQAAAYAYFRTILPLIQGASADAAAAVVAAINPGGAPSSDAFTKVQQALLPLLPAFGLTGADLGVFAPSVSDFGVHDALRASCWGPCTPRWMACPVPPHICHALPCRRHPHLHLCPSCCLCLERRPHSPLLPRAPLPAVQSTATSFPSARP